MLWKQTEAAIRVGADGVEWLVWQSKTERLLSARMTPGYSVGAALDQWLARAARLRMKPKRIWLIAGAAECAHRSITLPGTDPKVIGRAIPLAIEEDLPLPLSQMHWTYRTTPNEETQSTVVDVVATPIHLYTEWEEAIRERKLDLGGRIPEGPHLWHEMAAIRGSEIDLLAVWGERRVTLIRGNEKGMSSLQAFVREPGESWEALLNDLRRPFQGRDESKTILSIFTSERLRKRVLALPDLVPPTAETYLNTDLFLGVSEQVVVPVSLLALRRQRLEGRAPAVLFGDAELMRPRVELKKVATGLEVPVPAFGMAALVVISLALAWSHWRVGGRHAKELSGQVEMMDAQWTLLDQQHEALKDLAKARADWGSVWLQLSEQLPKQTLFKSFSYGLGAGIRVDGTTEGQAGVDQLVTLLREVGYLDNVRVPKTEAAEKKLSFEIRADIAPSKIKYYEVKNPSSPTAPGASPDPNQPKKNKPPERRRRQLNVGSAAPSSPTFRLAEDSGNKGGRS
ncbi:MAG: hypothetical protein HUU16_03500 [Candidatus Omnitrophica bacterium]|nr:hypothetical protein [bacterium]NUN95218.1 hypothetical protein [Candidatus Omnitrophota bacterium]